MITKSRKDWFNFVLNVYYDRRDLPLFSSLKTSEFFLSGQWKVIPSTLITKLPVLIHVQCSCRNQDTSKNTSTNWRIKKPAPAPSALVKIKKPCPFGQGSRNLYKMHSTKMAPVSWCAEWWSRSMGQQEIFFIKCKTEEDRDIANIYIKAVLSLSFQIIRERGKRKEEVRAGDQEKAKERF